MKLRSYTIIPQSLYVEREADRQLRRNLLEMERPAYVLVARQMGKTNLLLNAKRQSANSEIFCYIDASNPLPDLRSFLRSTVDVCLDSFPEHFSEAADEIHGHRSKELVEHKEHENELRAMLRAFNGKLIFCIDEIDALTRTDYSDRVFSLIRSIYFSGRTNFPEFSRLTYVLSGVAEPTEIIKDRSISPFNIGEKIYLNDFSESEIDDFLARAEINLSDDAKDRLIYWTGGNPRMTWDVCSGLSTITSAVNCGDIDGLVQHLYLRAFDIPPVDHIRMLAETDREIRDSLVSLHYGRHDTISDSIKTRLYLAGVTSIDEEKGITIFKNKIIEEALSEQWLKQIEQKDISQFEAAYRLFADGRFQEAVNIFSSIDSTSNVELWRAHYYAGICFYNLNEYTRAIEYFELNPVAKFQSVDFYYRKQSLLGSAMLRDGRIENAISVLERTISELEADFGNQPTPWFFQSTLNLCAAHLSSSPPNLRRVIDLCKRVLGLSELALDLESIEIHRYRSSALANLTTAHEQLGEKSAALIYLDQAIASSEGGEKITLLLRRATQFESRSDRGKTLDHCARIYLTCDVHIKEDSEAPNSFTASTASSLLFELASVSDSKILDELLKKMSMQSGTVDIISSVLTEAVITAFLKRGRLPADRLISKAISLTNIKPSPEHRQLVAISLMLSDLHPSEILENIFINTYLAGDSMLEPIELRTVYQVAEAHLINGHTESARAIFLAGQKSMLRAISAEADSFSSFELILLDYLDLATSTEFNEEGFVNRLFDLRIRLESYSGDLPAYYLPAFKDELLAKISLLNAKSRKRPILRPSPKIGRNQVVTVRLSDGTTKKGKFKNFQSRLDSGEAELITN